MEDDTTGKIIFSYQPVVRDMLVGVVATMLGEQEWIRRFDFTRMTPLQTEYISVATRGRRSLDVVWHLPLRDSDEGDGLYIVVMVELQSSVDPFMANRIREYSALIYQTDCMKKFHRKTGFLPPILPIVYYNGTRKWNAVKSMDELVGGGRCHALPGTPNSS